MENTISRQAAIDAILVYRHSVLSAEEIIETVPSAQPEQRWIPCCERLPEKHGEMYLVTISDGSVYSFALQWDINRKRWYLSFLNNGEIYIDYIDDVIAWMPLPEPYKEEGGNDD